jgi:hypothetical protein
MEQLGKGVALSPSRAAARAIVWSSAITSFTFRSMVLGDESCGAVASIAS